MDKNKLKILFFIALSVLLFVIIEKMRHPTGDVDPTGARFPTGALITPAALLNMEQTENSSFRERFERLRSGEFRNGPLITNV